MFRCCLSFVGRGSLFVVSCVLCVCCRCLLFGGVWCVGCYLLSLACSVMVVVVLFVVRCSLCVACCSLDCSGLMVVCRLWCAVCSCLLVVG